jgi:hypothetical protein
MGNHGPQQANGITSRQIPLTKQFWFPHGNLPVLTVCHHLSTQTKANNQQHQKAFEISPQSPT